MPGSYIFKKFVLRCDFWVAFIVIYNLTEQISWKPFKIYSFWSGRPSKMKMRDLSPNITYGRIDCCWSFEPLISSSQQKNFLNKSAVVAINYLEFQQLGICNWQ
jgi:hypothetical protein